MNKDKIRLIVVDLFCGAGGTSQGIEQAKDENGEKIAKVIVCINHDALAIESHKANHPKAKHLVEDIREVSIDKISQFVMDAKKEFPKAKLMIWASLECTHFSKAKGGDARDADSRSLASDLLRYISGLKPDFVGIENVQEFMSWGPMVQRSIDDEKFQIWNTQGKKDYYHVPYFGNEKIYNLNDIRPALYPEKRKNGKSYRTWVKSIESCGYKYDYRILNCADYGAYTSRKRFFSFFAVNGLKITFPSPTHSKKPFDDIFGKTKMWKPVKDVLDFTNEGNSILTRKKNLSEKTLERIYSGLLKHVAKGETAFLSKYYSGNPSSKNITVKLPAHTITTSDHHALIQITKNPNIVISEDVLAEASNKKNIKAFFDMQYGNGTPSSIQKPANTITTNDKHSLIVPKYFIMNPQFNNKGAIIEKPCFTLIASMHKRPPYIVLSQFGNVAIQTYQSDSPATVKIKHFMSAYGIYDVKMRMLTVDELKEITGFPKAYILMGSKARQKHLIGNAVPPIMARRLIENLVCSN